MNAADIMTHPVVTVTPDTTVADAARLMLQYRISGLPVVGRRGDIVGMLTEGDLLRRCETGTERRRPRWLEFLVAPGRLAAEYAHTHGRKVGELMSGNVVSVGPDDPLGKIVGLMEERQIKRLPVVDSGRLVGIVSRANLVRALVDRTPPPGAGPVSDREIRDAILAEIARQPWGPRASVDVQVENGIVELRGSITDDRERAALLVLAENTAGVEAVRDQLTWVDPLSGLVIAPGGSDVQIVER